MIKLDKKVFSDNILRIQNIIVDIFLVGFIVIILNNYIW